MELNSIVAAICDEADDFLAGVFKRDEARAGIAEWVTIHHSKLPPEDKKAVIATALSVLDREGFFERDAGGDD